jgi:SAM-dependent methyltransferase
MVSALIPRSSKLACGRIVFYLLSLEPPRLALRDLLELESELTRRQNEAATRYDDGKHVKHRLTRYHEFFVKRVQAHERVVDIGCGIGALSASIASGSGAEVVGIDIDASNIAQAMRRYPQAKLTFIHGDALKDLAPTHFDVIVLSNVLEHIDKRVAFLRAIQERFTPHRWLIRVPMIDRDWRVPLRQELGMFAFSDPTHYVEYTRSSFEMELNEAGLVVLYDQVNWGELWAEAYADGS